MQGALTPTGFNRLVKAAACCQSKAERKRRAAAKAIGSTRDPTAAQEHAKSIGRSAPVLGLEMTDDRSLKQQMYRQVFYVLDIDFGGTLDVRPFPDVQLNGPKILCIASSDTNRTLWYDVTDP